MFIILWSTHNEIINGGSHIIRSRYRWRFKLSVTIESLITIADCVLFVDKELLWLKTEFDVIKCGILFIICWRLEDGGWNVTVFDLWTFYPLAISKLEPLPRWELLFVLILLRVGDFPARESLSEDDGIRKCWANS